MRHAALRKQLTSDPPVLGAWCALDDSFSSEVLATLGFDYVCIDQQHGLTPFAAVVAKMQAITAGGSVPIVRVLQNDAGEIGRTLDAGACGVIVPMVNNRQHAEHAVAACRYAPAGTRSFGPIRARVALGVTAPAEIQETLCIVMVETQEALANVADIASTDGVDGIYIGPSDLSIDLGLDPVTGPSSSEFAAAAARIQGACHDAGIAAGIHCVDGQMARTYVEKGFQMVTVLSDYSTLARAASAELDRARGGSEATGH